MLAEQEAGSLDGLKLNAERVAAQLKAIGMECHAMQVFDANGTPCVSTADVPADVSAAITNLVERVRKDRQVSLARVGTGYAVGQLLGGADDALLAVGWFGGAISDRVVTVFQLALGWLHVSLLQRDSAESANARFLLDMLAQVFSLEHARSAAQEWVNRVSQLLRGQLPPTASCTVSYFRVEQARVAAPLWWVSSDTSWVEKGSSALNAATDLATRSAVEFREIVVSGSWAHPVVEHGEVIGVLVVDGAPEGSGLDLTRASAATIAPLLGYWHLGERGLPRHALAAFRDTWRKLKEPGFLTWKAGAVIVAFVLGLILLVPFDDHAVAKVLVEGQHQHQVTAPFQGYWAEVLVRPGDQVSTGQVMARLDTRDLLVEKAKLVSERDQASGKLRNAFAERDSAAVQIASAQLRQAEAQLALVEARLQRAEIRSPTTGVVIFGDWRDQLGSPVETGKKLFEVAAGERYRVVLQVLEEDIARVNIGQPGAIRVSGMPQREFAFKVNRITSVAAVTDTKNTFRVEAALSDSDMPLRPGMQGVGKVVVGRANLMTIWTRPFSHWLRMQIWSMWW